MLWYLLESSFADACLATCEPEGNQDGTIMPIHSVYTLSKDDPEARNWLGFFRRHGYSALTDLTIERVFWLEGDVKVERLLPCW